MKNNENENNFQALGSKKPLAEKPPQSDRGGVKKEKPGFIGQQGGANTSKKGNA